MSTIKISQLPNASLPLSGSESVPMVQNGVTKKASVAALSSFVNVKSYGAVGDGVADDTLAVQAAINASDGVFFPTGTYLVSSPITLKANNTIVGEGASSVISYTGTANGRGAFFVNSGSDTAFVDNITISDLKILGQVASLGFSEFVYNISFNGVRNCVIDRCVIEGFRGDGIYIGSGDIAGQIRHNINVTIRDCYFNGVNNDNRQGISVIDATGINIDNNYFVNTTRNNMPGAIDFEPDTFHNDYIIRDVSVRNNRFLNCGGNVGIITVFLPYIPFTTMPNGFNIENNYIENPTVTSIGYGIYFTYGGVSAPAIAESVPEFGIRICNNVVRAGSGNRCIGLGNANDTVIDGNCFIGGATSLIGSILDLTVTNNTFADVQSGVDPFAISITSGSRIRFEGNVFKDCGPASGMIGGGIEFAGGTTSYVDIVGNVFVSPGSFTQQAIRNTGHTFTAATNKLIGNSLIQGVNEFQAVTRLNNYPVTSVTNNIPFLGVNAASAAYRLVVDGGAGVAALIESDDTFAQAISTNSTVEQVSGYALGGFAYDGTVTNHPWGVVTNNTPRMQVDIHDNIVVSNASRATNATDGFLYIPSCAGTPTGTPRTYDTSVPIIVDRTNHKLYFYSGGSWRDAGP